MRGPAPARRRRRGGPLPRVLWGVPPRPAGSPPHTSGRGPPPPAWSEPRRPGPSGGVSAPPAARRPRSCSPPSASVGRTPRCWRPRAATPGAGCLCSVLVVHFRLVGSLVQKPTFETESAAFALTAGAQREGDAVLKGLLGDSQEVGA